MNKMDFNFKEGNGRSSIIFSYVFLLDVLWAIDAVNPINGIKLTITGACS